MTAKTNDFTARLPAFHRALAAWYKTHGRHHLPWRNTRDAYAIYVSEIMLQQTQVKTVLARYYGPFLKKFPTLQALAEAKQEAVIKQWEGLGYYNRAANLHKAAQQAKGQLPGTVEALMALPGIGRNTAHAVASFAFGGAHPVMEANVRRVLCRVFALTKADDKVLWQKAEQLLNRKNAFEYNQAMMDVGAMVCTKRKPSCSICPLNMLCKGQTNPEAYPAPKASKQVPVRKCVIVAVMDAGGALYLVQRKTTFLNGMYGFMEYPAGTKAVIVAGKRYTLTRKNMLGKITQSYSHFMLDATVYLLQTGANRLKDFHRATLHKIHQLPLSRADHKVVELIAGHK